MIEDLIDGLEQGWKDALAGFKTNDDYRLAREALNAILNVEPVNYHPTGRDILNAFHATPFDSVRVVIIGQDPYPCRRCSTGIAFFADGNLTTSLRNIYTAIEHDLQGSPTANCPERWAEQGVLLLNSALTLRRVSRVDRTNMHREPWKCFIQTVVEVLAGSGRPIHFMLWGTHARAFKRYAEVPPCTVRETRHPTAPPPRRDAVNREAMNFQTCQHFSAVNDILIARRGAMEREEEERIQGLNYEPIDWFPPE